MPLAIAVDPHPRVDIDQDTKQYPPSFWKMQKMRAAVLNAQSRAGVVAYVQEGTSNINAVMPDGAG